MKLKQWCTSAVAALSSLVLTVAVWAQTPDPDLDVKVTTDAGNPAWYSQWYIWALLAVFVIVVIALTNRGSSRPTT